MLKLKGLKSMSQGDIDANDFDEDDPIGLFLLGKMGRFAKVSVS